MTSLENKYSSHNQSCDFEGGSLPRRKKTRVSTLVDLDDTNIISSPTGVSDSGVRRSQRLRRKSFYNETSSNLPAACPFKTKKTNFESPPVSSSPLPSLEDLVSVMSCEPDCRLHCQAPEDKENCQPVVPDWLVRPYVAPSLRGLETILEVVPTPSNRQMPLRGCRPRDRGRLRRGLPLNESRKNTKSTVKEEEMCTPLIPLPPPKSKSTIALLRMQSFNSTATMDVICSDPTSDLAKFHLSAARTRARKQRAMLKRMKKRPEDVVTISEETERRFQVFILAAALRDDCQSPSSSSSSSSSISDDEDV